MVGLQRRSWEGGRGNLWGGVSTVHLVGGAPSPWRIFTRHHFPPTLTPALEPVDNHMGGR